MNDVRFGQVWESRDAATGSVRHLIVSSDAYNSAFGDRRVIAVEVDSSSWSPSCTPIGTLLSRP